MKLFHDMGGCWLSYLTPLSTTLQLYGGFQDMYCSFVCLFIHYAALRFYRLKCWYLNNQFKPQGFYRLKCWYPNNQFKPQGFVVFSISIFHFFFIYKFFRGLIRIVAFGPFCGTNTIVLSIWNVLVNVCWSLQPLVHTNKNSKSWFHWISVKYHRYRNTRHPVLINRKWQIDKIILRMINPYSTQYIKDWVHFISSCANFRSFINNQNNLLNFFYFCFVAFLL